VSPRLNSLESLFVKEGLREFGAKGREGILMHLSCVLDPRFPASARTGPVSTRRSSAGMIRLRRTGSLGMPTSLKSPWNPSLSKRDLGSSGPGGERLVPRWPSGA